MSSTQALPSFDSLEKAAEHLVERAVVGRVARQMRKEAFGLSDLKSLGSSALQTVKDNPMPFAGAGIGAAVSGGSALLNKDKRQHALRNALTGALTGGLTGLAGQLALRGYRGQPLVGAVSSPMKTPVPPAPSGSKTPKNLVTTNPSRDEIVDRVAKGKNPEGPLTDAEIAARWRRHDSALSTPSTYGKSVPYLSGAGAVGIAGAELADRYRNQFKFQGLKGVTSQGADLAEGLRIARDKLKEGSEEWKRLSRLHVAATTTPDVFQKNVAPLNRPHATNIPQFDWTKSRKYNIPGIGPINIGKSIPLVRGFENPRYRGNHDPQTGQVRWTRTDTPGFFQRNRSIPLGNANRPLGWLRRLFTLGDHEVGVDTRSAEGSPRVSRLRTPELKEWIRQGAAAKGGPGVIGFGSRSLRALKGQGGRIGRGAGLVAPAAIAAWLDYQARRQAGASALAGNR